MLAISDAALPAPQTLHGAQVLIDLTSPLRFDLQPTANASAPPPSPSPSPPIPELATLSAFAQFGWPDPCLPGGPGHVQCSGPDDPALIPTEITNPTSSAMRTRTATLVILASALPLGLYGPLPAQGGCTPIRGRDFRRPLFPSDLHVTGILGGPALYAAGGFTLRQRNTRELHRALGWRQLVWARHGAVGPNPAVSNATCMETFDDGSGPALYVGGHFDYAGGQLCHNVAKWDGSSWTHWAAGFPQHPANMRHIGPLPFDDGSGPALYAGGASRGRGRAR